MSKLYLDHLFKKIKLDSNVREALKQLVVEKAEIIFEKCNKEILGSKQFIKPLMDKLLEDLSVGDVDENLRRARLSEIKRQKTMLEAKLTQINTSLERIESPEPNKPIKPNLQIEKFRREYFEVQKKKSEEIAKKTKEYYQEQKRRQRKVEKQLEDLQDITQEQKEIELENAEKLKKKFKESYKRELRKMQKNSERRKKELAEVINNKHELIEVLNEKPMYQKIEERYVNEIEMKELERRKAELAKKRLNYQPLNKQELLEHIRRHDAIIKEKERASSHSNIDEVHVHHSRFISEIMKQDKIKKLEEEKLQQEKQKRLEDRISYGESVREMYSPTVDKFKQLELALRLEKMKNPVVKKQINHDKSTAAQSDTEIKRRVTKKYQQDINKEAVKSKPIDYLAERRKKRKISELDDDMSDFEWERFQDPMNKEKAQYFYQKANALEQKAKRAELSLTIGLPGKIENIDHSEKINSMLISSIKAKLAVLKHA